MTVEELLTPETIEGLKRFSADACAFSEMEPFFIEKYPEEWVAMLDGHVVAHHPDFETVLASLDVAGLPRGQVVVRFVTAEETIMIL